MRKTDLNLELISDNLSGKYDIPKISSGYEIPPKTLLPFNMAKGCFDSESAIHFIVATPYYFCTRFHNEGFINFSF